MEWQTNIYDEIPSHLEVIGKKIVDAAYKVHKNLGPGLLENIYEACLGGSNIKSSEAYK